MRRPALPLSGTALALLLAGCAADTTNYPSLARRPAERVTGSAEVAAAQPAPAPPGPPSAELSARLGQLISEAQGAHRDFVAKRARADGLVAAARGAAVASESWAIASIALAELEAARSRAMIALADLDQLHASTVIAAADRGDSADARAVVEARNQVVALVGEEDADLARLRGGLQS